MGSTSRFLHLATQREFLCHIQWRKNGGLEHISAQQGEKKTVHTTQDEDGQHLESARHRGAHVISQNQPSVVLVAVLHTLVQQHRWYGPQNPLHHCQVHVIVGEIEHW